MDEKQVNVIKKVLQDTAARLKPGSGSGKAVRNAALTVIMEEEQNRQPVSSMSDAELGELLKFNNRLITIADRYLDQVMDLPLTPEQAEEAEQLRERINTAQTNMEAERRELVTLRGDLARANADSAIQKATNDSLREQLKQKMAEYDELTAMEAALRENLEKYSDEAIQAQIDKNTELARQVAAQIQTYEEKTREYKELNIQRERNQNDIDTEQTRLDELQETVNAQPEELRQLEEAYSALDARLTRIRNAAEECSEERQEELRGQIETLEPEVNALVEKHGELTATLGTLNAAHTKELEETAAAEEQLLASMNAAVDTLGEHSEALADKLRAAIARADQFESNLKLCRDAFDRYHSWFESDAPALIAMSEKAGLSEKQYQTLFETLNPAECDVIRRLMDETEERLTRLDQILSSGAAAAKKDQDETRRLAEVGGAPSPRN